MTKPEADLSSSHEDRFDKQVPNPDTTAHALWPDHTQLSINLSATALSQALVPVSDRGFLFGDSIYEVVVAYGTTLFGFDEHFARLQRSARRIHLELPFDKVGLKQHIQQQVNHCLAAWEAKPSTATDRRFYTRIMVSRGCSLPSIEPPKQAKPRTVIVTYPLQPWPAELYAQGLRLKTTDIRRNHRTALDPQIKSGNYLNNVLAIYEAKNGGFDDAVLLNQQGQVTESTTSNLFCVKNNQVITPPIASGLLDGITRAFVLKLLTENHQEAIEREILQEDLYDADEVFISSTTREIMPVSQIDHQSYRCPGPLTIRLQELFRNHVEATVKCTT